MTTSPDSASRSNPRFLRGASGQVWETAWPDAGSPWRVRVHWVQDGDGQARCVGVDLRSFWDEATPAPMTRHGFADLSAEVVRSLRVGELVEASRRAMLAEARQVGHHIRSDAEGQAAAEQAVAPLAGAAAPRRLGRPLDRPLEHYQRVGLLYDRAKASGSRRVARDVHEQLLTGSADDPPANQDQTNRWIATARRLGYVGSGR